jgi:hypothetical protein
MHRRTFGSSAVSYRRALTGEPIVIYVMNTTIICSSGSRRRSKSVTSGQASSPPYFRGGATPAGSSTCATFKVIDTRL